MIVKSTIFKKVLGSGAVAEFLVIKRDEDYEAALFLNGKYVGGPSSPMELTPPKGDITHWMGNKPSIGLTRKEAEQIMYEVEVENSALRHMRKSNADDPDKCRPWRHW